MNEENEINPESIDTDNQAQAEEQHQAENATDENNSKSVEPNASSDSEEAKETGEESTSKSSDDNDRIKTLESRLEALEVKPAPAPSTPNPMPSDLNDPETGQPLVEPNKDDFDDAKDFMAALIEHGKKKQQAETNFKVQQEQMAAYQRKVMSHQQREQTAINKYPDYKEAAYGDFAVTNLMGELIMDSDKGPDVLYWLGKHPQESARIAEMSQRNPLHAAMAIGRIESKLVEKKVQSNAPKPVQPLGNSRTTQLTPERMSDNELENYLYGG